MERVGSISVVSLVKGKLTQDPVQVKLMIVRVSHQFSINLSVPKRSESNSSVHLQHHEDTWLILIPPVIHCPCSLMLKQKSTGFMERLEQGSQKSFIFQKMMQYKHKSNLFISSPISPLFFDFFSLGQLLIPFPTINYPCCVLRLDASIPIIPKFSRLVLVNFW